MVLGRRVPPSPPPTWATIPGKLDTCFEAFMQSDPKFIESPDEGTEPNQSSSESEKEQDQVDELRSQSATSAIPPLHQPAPASQPPPQVRSSMPSPATRAPASTQPLQRLPTRRVEESPRPPPATQASDSSNSERPRQGGTLNPDRPRPKVRLQLFASKHCRLQILKQIPLRSFHSSDKDQPKEANMKDPPHPCV